MIDFNVLIPPMTYITRITSGDPVNFWQYYRGFWRLNADDLVGRGGTLTPAHLWFLIVLFVFSDYELSKITCAK